MGTDQCKELGVLGGSFFGVCRHLFSGEDQITGVSCTITGKSQAEPMEHQSRLATFASEAIVLSSVLGRGKEKASGEMAVSLLLLPSFQG